MSSDERAHAQEARSRNVEHHGTPVSIERLKLAHSSVRDAWFDHAPLSEPSHGHPVYRQSQDEECFFCAVIAGWEHAEAALAAAERRAEEAERERDTLREALAGWLAARDGVAEAQAALTADDDNAAMIAKLKSPVQAEVAALAVARAALRASTGSEGAEREYQIALREDDLGLDDVVVCDVAMFRMERMDEDSMWLCCYLTDGQRIDFDMWLSEFGIIRYKARDPLPDVVYEEKDTRNGS